MAGPQTALTARNSNASTGSRPNYAHHGAILRGVIVGPITPPMRAAQIYNVHLEGIVRSVLRNVPLAAPAGQVSYNGATYLAYLQEGDHVLVGFNNSTNNPVILCSLCVSEYPGKVDNVTNQQTLRQDYVQPPGSAFKDFLPTWLYQAQVYGYIAPYDLVSIEHNQINPNTTAGTRMPGVFTIATGTGDRLEYTPGTTYRMSVGPVVNSIPGIEKKPAQASLDTLNQITQATNNMTSQILGGGDGAGNSSTGTRFGEYRWQASTNPQLWDSAQKVTEIQELYKAEVAKNTQQWEEAWKLCVFDEYQAICKEWSVTGAGIYPTIAQPFTLEEAIKDKPLPFPQVPLGDGLPTILSNEPPTVHSGDPNSPGGKSALDGIVGVAKKGISLLKPIYSLSTRLFAALNKPSQRRGKASQKQDVGQVYSPEAREAVELLTVVVDQYGLPAAPELTATLEWLGSAPMNLLTVLDFYIWVGDRRAAVAATALKILIAPHYLSYYLQDLQTLWEYTSPVAVLPTYVVKRLEAIPRGLLEALPPVWQLVNVPTPDLAVICEHPWRVGYWLGGIDSRFKEVAEAWEAGDVASAVLILFRYGQGANWSSMPKERIEVYKRLQILTRRYRWQLL